MINVTFIDGSRLDFRRLPGPAHFPEQRLVIEPIDEAFKLVQWNFDHDE